MFPSGVICTVIVGLVAGRVSMIWLISKYPYVLKDKSQILIYSLSLSLSAVTGTVCTTVACALYATVDPSAPYWAFCFPGVILSVIGGDFTFAAGTLFVAKVTDMKDQSLAGAVFQCMTQVIFSESIIKS